MNPKAGCAGSVLDLLHIAQFNHQAELETGVLEEECSQLMKQFFRELRQRKKEEKEEKKRAESIVNSQIASFDKCFGKIRIILFFFLMES